MCFFFKFGNVLNCFLCFHISDPPVPTSVDLFLFFFSPLDCKKNNNSVKMRAKRKTVLSAAEVT